MVYRGYEIKKVKAINKKTKELVTAYQSVGKAVRSITKAQQNIDLYRLTNVKSVDCK